MISGQWEVREFMPSYRKINSTYTLDVDWIIFYEDTASVENDITWTISKKLWIWKILDLKWAKFCQLDMGGKYSRIILIGFEVKAELNMFGEVVYFPWCVLDPTTAPDWLLRLR